MPDECFCVHFQENAVAENKRKYNDIEHIQDN